MKFSFFHTPKPRTFNYIPRYYNPEQEALEKKKAAMGLDSKLSEREKRRMRIRNAYGYDPEDYKEKSKIGFKTVRFVLFFGLMFFHWKVYHKQGKKTIFPKQKTNFFAISKTCHPVKGSLRTHFLEVYFKQNINFTPSPLTSLLFAV